MSGMGPGGLRVPWDFHSIMTFSYFMGYLLPLERMDFFLEQEE